MDLQLDNFTVLAASCVALLFLGSAILYFWNRDRRATWLFWWSLPYLTAGLAITAYMQPGWEQNFVGIALGNAARILALGFAWMGARAFAGRPLIIWPLVVLPLVWIGLCAIPGFMGLLAARVVGTSAFVGTFAALTAWELWRERADALPSRLPAVVVLTSLALVMLIRVLGVAVLPFPVGAAPLDAAWMAGFNLLILVHAGFLGILLIALTKERAEAEQRSYALLDPLTGLMNRRALLAQMQRMAHRHGQARGGAAVLVLDLDDFKQVNDQFGHEAGDRVLAAFATIAERSIRASDMLYRMGGEEFCCILPDTGVAEALAVAERIRTAFAAHEVESRGRAVSTTVSIGIAVTDHAGFDLDLLLASADAAVYEAKARGRNRVVVAEPPTLDEPDPVIAFPDRRRA